MFYWVTMGVVTMTKRHWRQSALSAGVILMLGSGVVFGVMWFVYRVAVWFLTGE